MIFLLLQLLNLIAGEAGASHHGSVLFMIDVWSCVGLLLLLLAYSITSDFAKSCLKAYLPAS